MLAKSCSLVIYYQQGPVAGPGTLLTEGVYQSEVGIIIIIIVLPWTVYKRLIQILSLSLYIYIYIHMYTHISCCTYRPCYMFRVDEVYDGGRRTFGLRRKSRKALVARAARRSTGGGRSGREHNNDNNNNDNNHDKRWSLERCVGRQAAAALAASKKGRGLRGNTYIHIFTIVCIYIYMFVHYRCMYVCIHKYIHIYIYIIYGEREREREICIMFTYTHMIYIYI